LIAAEALDLGRLCEELRMHLLSIEGQFEFHEPKKHRYWRGPVEYVTAAASSFASSSFSVFICKPSDLPRVKYATTFVNNQHWALDR